MADALSRALSAGVSLAEIKKMQADGLPLEEIANAAEKVQSRGEEEIAEDVRPGDFSDVGNMDKFLELNEGRLLFTDSRGWLYWNGVCWVADDHRLQRTPPKCRTRCCRKRRPHTGKHFTPRRTQKRKRKRTKRQWKDRRSCKAGKGVP